MSFLFWNIKYVFLPAIFEVVSFSRVSKYLILSSSFKLLTDSIVCWKERMELIANAIVSWPIHQEVPLVLYIASIAD